MQNPYMEELEIASSEQLHLTPPQMLSVIGRLEELRVLLGADHLYTQRCIGLAKGTNKENPIDCPFVLKALREMLTTNKEDLVKAVKLLSEIQDILT